jgi:WD repeat-containing protein 19
VYYEDEKDYANAAHYYSKIGDYPRAIKLFLQCDTQHIDAAIGVVKKAQGQPGSELLVRQLHDFLIGETDGKVKDLNYIFRLYMAIGEFGQAASTAILIANQEQVNGQYSVAHSILYAMHQDLCREKLPIPNELRRNLLLLHSYTLAKKMSVKKDHEQAARMLVRVAKNISRFPSHVVPILTSTVIECQRAGLKKDSLEYAKILLRPEHKPKIMAQYVKPIEGIVRRPPTQEELDKEKTEKASPCPYCAFDLPETLLDCPSCKNNLPYCITTGKHMLMSDWTECPSCRFPTLYSAFVSHISTSADKKCCMCDQVVNVADVIRIKDPTSKLMKEEPQAAGEADKSAAAPGGPGGAAKSSSSSSSSSSSAAPNKFDAVDIQPIFK